MRRVPGVAGAGLTLQELFVGRTSKSEMIGLFLATLELIRQKKIAVEQAEPLGEIRIRLSEGGSGQMLFEGENVVGPGASPVDTQIA